MSAVVDRSACPRLLLTIASSSPSSSIRVAYACRRSWNRWRGRAELYGDPGERVDDLHAREEARATVETRYLGGHPANFPDVLDAWATDVRESERMAVMALRICELDRLNPIDEERDISPDPEKVARYVVRQTVHSSTPLGLGWVIWRDASDLPGDLIFNVNYLGDTIAEHAPRDGQGYLRVAITCGPLRPPSAHADDATKAAALCPRPVRRGCHGSACRRPGCAVTLADHTRR
jgi:hypothetical protein